MSRRRQDEHDFRCARPADVCQQALVVLRRVCEREQFNLIFGVFLLPGTVLVPLSRGEQRLCVLFSQVILLFALRLCILHHCRQQVDILVGFWDFLLFIGGPLPVRYPRLCLRGPVPAIFVMAPETRAFLVGASDHR